MQINIKNPTKNTKIGCKIENKRKIRMIFFERKSKNLRTYKKNDGT